MSDSDDSSGPAFLEDSCSASDHQTATASEQSTPQRAPPQQPAGALGDSKKEKEGDSDSSSNSSFGDNLEALKAARRRRTSGGVGGGASDVSDADDDDVFLASSSKQNPPAAGGGAGEAVKSPSCSTSSSIDDDDDEDEMLAMPGMEPRRPAPPTPPEEEQENDDVDDQQERAAVEKEPLADRADETVVATPSPPHRAALDEREDQKTPTSPPPNHHDQRQRDGSSGDDSSNRTNVKHEEENAGSLLGDRLRDVSSITSMPSFLANTPTPAANSTKQQVVHGGAVVDPFDEVATPSPPPSISNYKKKANMQSPSAVAQPLERSASAQPPPQPAASKQRAVTTPVRKAIDSSRSGPQVRADNNDVIPENSGRGRATNKSQQPPNADGMAVEGRRDNSPDLSLPSMGGVSAGEQPLRGEIKSASNKNSSNIQKRVTSPPRKASTSTFRRELREPQQHLGRVSYASTGAKVDTVGRYPDLGRETKFAMSSSRHANTTSPVVRELRSNRQPSSSRVSPSFASGGGGPGYAEISQTRSSRTAERSRTPTTATAAESNGQASHFQNTPSQQQLAHHPLDAAQLQGALDTLHHFMDSITQGHSMMLAGDHHHHQLSKQLSPYRQRGQRDVAEGRTTNGRVAVKDRHSNTTTPDRSSSIKRSSHANSFVDANRDVPHHQHRHPTGSATISSQKLLPSYAGPTLRSETRHASPSMGNTSMPLSSFQQRQLYEEQRREREKQERRDARRKARDVPQEDRVREGIMKAHGTHHHLDSYVSASENEDEDLLSASSSAAASEVPAFVADHHGDVSRITMAETTFNTTAGSTTTTLDDSPTRRRDFASPSVVPPPSRGCATASNNQQDQDHKQTLPPHDVDSVGVQVSPLDETSMIDDSTFGAEVAREEAVLFRKSVELEELIVAAQQRMVSRSQEPSAGAGAARAGGSTPDVRSQQQPQQQQRSSSSIAPAGIPLTSTVACSSSGLPPPSPLNTAAGPSTTESTSAAAATTTPLHTTEQALETNVASLMQQISTSQSHLNSLEKEVLEKKELVDYFTAEIASLISQKTSLQNDIRSLQVERQQEVETFERVRVDHKQALTTLKKDRHRVKEEVVVLRNAKTMLCEEISIMESSRLSHHREGSHHQESLLSSLMGNSHQFAEHGQQREKYSRNDSDVTSSLNNHSSALSNALMMMRQGGTQFERSNTATTTASSVATTTDLAASSTNTSLSVNPTMDSVLMRGGGVGATPQRGRTVMSTLSSSVSVAQPVKQATIRHQDSPMAEKETCASERPVMMLDRPQMETHRTSYHNESSDDDTGGTCTSVQLNRVSNMGVATAQGHHHEAAKEEHLVRGGVMNDSELSSPARRPQQPSPLIDSVVRRVVGGGKQNGSSPSNVTPPSTSRSAEQRQIGASGSPSVNRSSNRTSSNVGETSPIANTPNVAMSNNSLFATPSSRIVDRSLYSATTCTSLVSTIPRERDIHTPAPGNVASNTVEEHTSSFQSVGHVERRLDDEEDTEELKEEHTPQRTLTAVDNLHQTGGTPSLLVTSDTSVNDSGLVAGDSVRHVNGSRVQLWHSALEDSEVSQTASF